MSKIYKNIHIILSLFKLLVGLTVLIVVWLYIDPFQDPETWVIIWSIGLLFFVWWFSYFVFYLLGLRLSDKKVHLISSYSYRASLVIALFVLTNIVLLMIEFWSTTNGLLILLVFGLSYRFLFHRPVPLEHTSIDMIVEEKHE